MTPRGIGLKLGWLAFVPALAWMTECSPPNRNFGPLSAAGAGNESGGSAGSSVAGRAPSVGGETGSTGGAPGLGGAGLAADAGMSANLEGGTGTAGAGTAGAGTAGASASALPDGQTCQADVACVNGHCVDGVCCKSTCTGCNACSNALTGQNNGTCAPVASGQDPHAACADETATKQCGTDGTCDGKGACSKVGSSHVCTAAGCSSDGKTFIPTTTCAGDGECTSATPQDCAGFPCTPMGCAKPCTMTAECGATNYCNTATGKCVARKSDGSAATSSNECTSGIIADGVCCNSACTGQCQSCKQTPGACKAVTTPRNPCGGSGTCGTMKCDGAHADCVAPGNEVSCGSSCSSDLTAKISSTCNGAGACGAGQSTACNGQYCSGGQCVAKIPNDTGGCAKDVACTSGHCATSSSGGTMCCAAGYSNCSQGCFNVLNSVAHCGNCSTAACDANEVCSSGSCQCAHGSAFSCTLCPSWDFESNTTGGWTTDPVTNVPVSPKILATPSGATFSGSHSLAFNVSHIGPGPQTAGVVVPFCDSTTQDVSGLSFYLYFDGPAYSVSKYEIAHVDGPQSEDGINFLDFATSVPSKKWIFMSRTFASVAATQLEFRFQPNDDWSGTIYIDEVQLTH